MITLTASQSGLPSHSHSASSGGASVNHSHTLSTSTSSSGSHTHAATLTEGITSGDSQSYIDTADKQSPTEYVTDAVQISSAGAHTHSVSGTTSGHSADHSHTITVNAAGGTNAAASIDVTPKYWALTYIIKK